MTEAQGLQAEIRALRETLGRVCDDQAFCRLSESVIEEVQTALGIVPETSSGSMIEKTDAGTWRTA
jgi:hypothetical protein